MKLRDLLVEARIFQNNFIKVGMVEEELKSVFGEEEMPKVEFDADGMFIKMDNFKMRDYETAGGLKKFSLSDAGLVDEIKNIKKYYIEFTKVENKSTAVPTEETPTEA